MSLVLIATAVLLGLHLAGELVLAALNRAEVRRHASSPPPAVAAIMDDATYQKSVAYTLVRSRFGVLREVFDTLVLALVVFGGVLPWLYSAVVAWGGPTAVWSRTLFILIAGVLLSVPGLPFDWWEQFRIEARFGFNQSTPRLWVTDKLKGVLIQQKA